MKTTLKVLGAIGALGLIILVGLHLVMVYGLTKAMNDVVLPRVKQETGIDAKVGRLSINMTSGLLFLNDIAVRNPEGFLLENLASIEGIKVQVDIPSLFRKKLIRVNDIQVENALINVIRNKDGVINLSKLQEGLPKPSHPPGEPVPPSDTKQTVPGPGEPAPAPVEKQKPIQEMLIEAISCSAKVRYIDFKLNQLDIALNLKLNGTGLSTQRDPDVPWGTVSISGALGNDRASFITELNLKLAPVTDPQEPSFDLTGKILEIDPKIMATAYSKLGIRSAPFGLDPQFYCRRGWYEHSKIALNMRDIELENKLADRLGGMARIGSLHFAVPVEGSLQEPVIEIMPALVNAIGSNTGSFLDSLLKGAAGKEAGLDQPPETLPDAAVEVLGKHVDEVGKSETVKKVLKDLADGEPSSTNAPDPISSDTVIDILGEQVDEIGENEELKDDLKNLGKWLFGK